MHLTADLERAVLRELQAAWIDRNTRDFRGELRPIVLRLHDDGPLGVYRDHTRTISLQRELVISRPWGQVIEVLRHEMAHQYVRQTRLAPDESPHGPAFRKICKERGIDARAAGLPAPEHSPEESKIIRRIQALLRLAESPEPNEAAAAANAARRLLAQHDVSLNTHGSNYTFRQVGPTKGRFDPWEKCLFAVLTEHFGVDGILARAYRPDRGRWGRVLEILGPVHHVEVASYVHDFLRVAGESAWRAHRKQSGSKSNADRRTFLFGVMDGFRQSLAAEPTDAEHALVSLETPGFTQYFTSRYPRVRRGRRQRVRVNDATEAGRSVGRTLKVRPGVSAHGDGPRLLPGD